MYLKFRKKRLVQYFLNAKTKLKLFRDLLKVKNKCKQKTKRFFSKIAPKVEKLISISMSQ